jgi:hypothetical protein
MSKSALKFYVVPGIVALVIIVILLLIPINNKKIVIKNDPSPTIVINLPTKALIPNKTMSPTLIPPQSFTGANINQEIPQELRTVGEQKTTLRRLTPLTLSFGIIEFDYENDQFILTLNSPKDEAQNTFNIWREQNYSALSQEQFAIR